MMIEKAGEEKASEVLAVKGDRGLLIALLYDLVHNAVKASRPGERIWLTAEGGTMAIRDEGFGISEKDLSRATEASYMTDKSRSRSEGGPGLGLAFCERIALLYGFRMEIRSLWSGQALGVEKKGKRTEVILLSSVYRTFTL